MVSKLKVTGLEKLVANNQALADTLARESRIVIIDEANKLVATIKSRVPVRTGALRDAIKKRVWMDKQGVTGAVVGITAGSDRPEFHKGKSYYPASQEYGWTVGRMHLPGQPYIRPSFDERKPVIKTRLQSTMKKIVDGVKPR